MWSQTVKDLNPYEALTKGTKEPENKEQQK